MQAFAQSSKNANLQPSSANDDTARALFQAGKSAYQAGKFREAQSYFEQAYELSGRDALLYNIGQAADRARQDDKAIEYFTKCLDKTPDAPNRAEVEQRLLALREAHRIRQEQQRRSRDEAAAGVALTPEQTAEEAPEADTQPNAIMVSDLQDDRSKSEPLTEKWWFWTALGAVVVGGTVTALTLTTLGGEETEREAPYQGSVGSFQGP